MQPRSIINEPVAAEISLYSAGTPAPPGEHLLAYGQSLSVGERATILYPTNNNIPPPSFVPVGSMFAGGTRPSDLSSLIPFAESTNPVDLTSWNIATPGETPLYGALLQLTNRPGGRIGSAAGKGGSSVLQLSKGTAPYTRLLAQITAARNLVPAYAYSVLGIIWMQGENDAGNAAYAAQFTQLILDLDGDVRGLTGVQKALQFYVCLPAPRDIAAAQIAVAAVLPQVHIVCDSVNFAHSDGVHLTAAASRQVGVLLGQAVI